MTEVTANAPDSLALAPLFTDHAVLQRDKPVPVWGWASPGEQVTVRYRGQAHPTAAGPDGRWEIRLDPMPAARDGADLVVEAATTLTRRDVVVGEVWLCSGQSNMGYALNRADNAAAEMAAADFPLLRLFAVEQTTAEAPADTVPGRWQPSSPATAGTFSAVAFFFGRNLLEALDVPIGVIRSTWGGTAIESWLSAESLARDPAFAVAALRWQVLLEKLPANKAAFDRVLSARAAAEAQARTCGEEAHQLFLRENPPPVIPPEIRPSSQPSSLFNGMIHPLLPFALRGILWYQGESNATRAGEYHALFVELISSWRTSFGQGDLPFYWVQLPNYKGDPNSDWPRLRAAQTNALTLPATAQAITIDVGDRDDIHPSHKQPVGRRLALLAQARVYGLPSADSGPVFVRAVRKGPALRVVFNHAEGLRAEGDVQALEIAGADRLFHPAQGAIDGTALLVSSPAVDEPVAVRYAWSPSPAANLYNLAGLPAAPFRSDDW